MPEEIIKEIGSSILWLKWGIGIELSVIGVLSAALIFVVRNVIRTVTKFQVETQKKIDSAFEVIGRDIERIANKAEGLDQIMREIEQNIVRHQGEIDGIIAVCKERHK